MDSSANIAVPTTNASSDPTTPSHHAEELTTLEQLGGICCNLCPGTFEHKKQFDQHFAFHHKHESIVYKCILCGKTFLKYKTFHDHCYRHVSGKRFRCEICRKQFHHRAFVLHMQTFHLEANWKEDQSFPCSECSRNYSSFKDLVHHLRFCNRDQPYTCAVCNKSFSEKSFLLRHLPIHSEIRNFKCSICDSSFKTKRSLSVHSMLHLENRTLNYECKYCRKRFLTSTKLAFHMNTHSGERPYRCDHCELTFTNNPNRIKHMRQHVANKHDQCRHENLELIGTVMQNKEDYINSGIQGDGGEPKNIKIHGTINTGNGQKQFCCEYCTERFLYRRSWLRHMKRRHIHYKYHCNSCDKVVVCSNPIDFICDHCGIGFTDKSNLVRHILYKHMQREYRCTVCTRAFISPEELKAHSDKHKKLINNKQVTRIASKVMLSGSKKKHVLKEFICQYCQKEFTYLRSCTRHMKQVHNHKIVKKPKTNNLNGEVREVKVVSPKENSNSNCIGDSLNGDTTGLEALNKSLIASKTQEELKERKICSIYITRPYYFILDPKESTGKYAPEVIESSSFIQSDETYKASENNDEDLLNLFGSVLRANNEFYSDKESENSQYIPVESKNVDCAVSDLQFDNENEIGNVNSILFDSESGNNSDALSTKAAQIHAHKKNMSIMKDFITSPCLKDVATTQSQNTFETAPESILEPASKGFSSSVADLCEYTSERHICDNVPSNMWNNPQPAQVVSDIFGLYDDTVLPHIDPRLTLKKSNYTDNFIGNLFPAESVTPKNYLADAVPVTNFGAIERDAPAHRCDYLRHTDARVPNETKVRDALIESETDDQLEPNQKETGYKNSILSLIHQEDMSNAASKAVVLGDKCNFYIPHRWTSTLQA